MKNLKLLIIKGAFILCAALLFNGIAVAQVYMPTFRGGSILEFKMWVVRNAELTKEQTKIKGETKIVFFVNSEGVVEQVEVLEAPNEEIGEIYRKVVESSPKWQPAVQKGKKVGVKMVLPINR